jgi:hypothetical protein
MMKAQLRGARKLDRSASRIVKSGRGHLDEPALSDFVALGVKEMDDGS